MKCSGVITNDRSDVHATDQVHRSKIKITVVKRILPRSGRFWTITSVWMHIWLRNDAQSLKWTRRSVLLFFKVIHQIKSLHGPTILRRPIIFSGHPSRLHGPTNQLISPKLNGWGSLNSQWLRNDAQSLKWHRRGALLFFEVIHQISRSHGPKSNDLASIWGFPDNNSNLN